MKDVRKTPGDNSRCPGDIEFIYASPVNLCSPSAVVWDRPPPDGRRDAATPPDRSRRSSGGSDSSAPGGGGGDTKLAGFGVGYRPEKRGAVPLRQTPGPCLPYTHSPKLKPLSLDRNRSCWSASLRDQPWGRRPLIFRPCKVNLGELRKFNITPTDGHHPFLQVVELRYIYRRIIVRGGFCVSLPNSTIYKIQDLYKDYDRGVFREH